MNLVLIYNEDIKSLDLKFTLKLYKYFKNKLKYCELLAKNNIAFDEFQQN